MGIIITVIMPQAKSDFDMTL